MERKGVASAAPFFVCLFTSSSLIQEFSATFRASLSALPSKRLGEAEKII
jgi:hypothetical protein